MIDWKIFWVTVAVLIGIIAIWPDLKVFWRWIRGKELEGWKTVKDIRKMSGKSTQKTSEEKGE